MAAADGAPGAGMTGGEGADSLYATKRRDGSPGLRRGRTKVTAVSILALKRRGAAALAGLALLSLERPAAAWSSSCEVAQRFTLQNGVEVVLVPETRSPAVALVSSIHVGFRNDPPGHEGLAHYVEHLTFAGTSSFQAAMDLYQEIGATGVNGTTSADTTDYFALVPSSQLERAIWIEARRLGLGVNAATEEQALTERRVLLREHAMRSGYAPGYSLLKATYAALYPPEHPYHSSFASEDSIERLTLGDARWFAAQHYRPDQTRLVLVGDFVPEAAKALVETHFGALERRAPPPAEAAVASAGSCRWANAPQGVARARIVQHTRLKNERLELFWPVTPGENTELSRGAFSTLHGELSAGMRQTGFSHRVSAELVELELGAFWVVRIEVAPGQPFEKVEPLVGKLFQMVRAGVDSDQNQLAKRQSLELADQLARQRLMGRALGLARRTCADSACVAASEIVTVTDQLTDRFALKSALVVERRYSIGASEGGDLEVVR
jgi:hypothetical protein